MIKTSVIQTFFKIDSENLSLNTNKSTREINPCTVKDGELVQFGVLLQLTNSTETSQLSEWKFTSMGGSLKCLKNVTDTSSSIDPKEIFGTTCDDIHEGNVTSLPEYNSLRTNVPRSKTERTDTVLSIPQTDFIPCVSIPKIVRGIDDQMKSGTNENTRIKNEIVDVTRFRSKTSEVPVINSEDTGMAYVTGKSREMMDSTEINSKVTTNSAIINEMIDGLGISITITDVAGITSEYTFDPRNDIKRTDVAKIHCETIDGIDEADSTIISIKTTVDPGTNKITMIPNETVNATSNISELTDSRKIDRTTDVAKLHCETIDATEIGIDEADPTIISIKTTVDPGTNKITMIPNDTAKATNNISELTDSRKIDRTTGVAKLHCETIDATEINSKVTTNSAIINETTNGLGISIIITDVAGITSEYTYDPRNDIKTTDVTKINRQTIDAIKIGSDKADPTIISIKTTVDPGTTNIIMIPNETVNVTKNISELTGSQRIDNKTTHSFSKLDAKSAKTSTETNSGECYTSNNFQAKTIAKYKSKIPKTSKKAFKQFALKMEKTNESLQKVLPISEQYLHAKALPVASYARKYCAKQTYDIEKFLDAVNLTNEDMVKKSGILLQKQKLVAEVLSYVHAVQSIFRLSNPCLFSNDTERNKVNNQFYEAGVYILEEMKRYQSELKADFKGWEEYRKKILDISEGIPYEFKLCENKKSVRELMRDITCEICDILKKMEIISSKREERNEECNDLMDGIDTYIKYSSAFIMGENTLRIF